MLTGRDIICISSIDWDFIWQGHQEIMATFARQGNRVLFIENTGVRRPTFRDLPRLRGRLRNWRRGFKGFRQEQENLFVYSPLVLPAPYSRLARWFNRQLLGRTLHRWMRAVGFRRPIVWTFLPTPLARDLIRDLDPELTIYYCIDNFASSSAQARRITQSENQLFRDADLVFVTSTSLRERAEQFASKVHLFPFAVNYEVFERARTSPDSIPDDVRDLARPIVGYVGGIHQCVDQALLAEVAARLPETEFVLVGPPQVDVSVLEQRPNIRLLGKRPHSEVPNYIKAFDVAVIPYTLSEYSASVYPTKLNEYLAMGVPVIATDLREIQRFNEEHDGAVAVVGSADEFVRAIGVSAADRSPEAVARRVDIARENSWERRIEKMSGVIDAALDARENDRKAWQSRLRRAYRTARRRMVAATATIAAIYFLVSYTPFIWNVAAPLRISDTPVRSDAVVVFAGGVGESGRAGGGYLERLKRALELHQAGLADTLVFSSGYVFAFREAEVMREIALANGVDPADIILETNAANTHDNVVFTSAIARARGWRRVMLVSSPYHMRRALMVWHKAAPDIQAVSTPVPVSQFYLHETGASLEQVRGILHEFAAIAGYWWRGWI